MCAGLAKQPCMRSAEGPSSCDTGGLTVFDGGSIMKHTVACTTGEKLVCVGLLQLQQLACGASLLAEPLRGAVIRALEMERKCCKWCAGTPAAPAPPLLLPVLPVR